MLSFDGLDWDEGNEAKTQGHGLTRDEIEEVFSAEALILPDPEHSAAEQRSRLIGRSFTGRPMFV